MLKEEKEKKNEKCVAYSSSATGESMLLKWVAFRI